MDLQVLAGREVTGVWKVRKVCKVQWVRMAHQAPLGPGANLAHQCKAPRVTEARKDQRVDKECKDRKERVACKDLRGLEARGGRKEIKETTARKDRRVIGDLRAYAEIKALLDRLA